MTFIIRLGEILYNTVYTKTPNLASSGCMCDIVSRISLWLCVCGLFTSVNTHRTGRCSSSN